MNRNFIESNSKFIHSNNHKENRTMENRYANSRSLDVKEKVAIGGAAAAGVGACAAGTTAAIIGTATTVTTAGISAAAITGTGAAIG